MLGKIGIQALEANESNHYS